MKNNNIKEKKTLPLFAKLGIAAVAITLSAGVYKSEVFPKYELLSEVVQSIQSEIDKGVTSRGAKNINIEISTEYTGENFWSSKAYEDRVDSGICQIKLTAGGRIKDMVKTSGSLSAEDLSDINSMITEKSEIIKSMKLTGYHELYHCDENVLDGGKRFNIPNKPELSQSLNSIYNGKTINFSHPLIVASNDGKILQMDGNIDILLKESFAEAASSISILQNYGKDSFQVLGHRFSVSAANAIDIMKEDYFLRTHATYAINAYFTTDEGLKDAQSLSSVEQVRERSWEIANKNMLQALKSRGNLEQLFEGNYWKKETLLFWKNAVIAEHTNTSIQFSDVMQERIKELKSNLTSEKVKSFERVVIDEFKGKSGADEKACVFYKELLDNFPKLNAGEKEISIIKDQLPKAIKEIEANPIYSIKSVKEAIDISGAKVNRLSINVPKSSGDNKAPSGLRCSSSK